MQVTYSFNPSTIAKSSEVNQNFTDVQNAIKPTFVFTIVGTLITGTSLTPALIVNKSLTIEKAYAYVKTAPTGAAVILDIKVNGTSIWSVTPANRLQIAAVAQSGNQTIFDSTSLSEGDILTVDVPQVGSTISGSDLTIELRCG